MTAIAFAALSALVWGSADYCGGRATQRASALGVTVASQVLGAPVLVACMLLVPGFLRAADLAWGAAAGTAGLFGIVLLYRGLSAGPMVVVAPVTAVTSAAIPMIVGLLTERIPTTVALGGVACAIIAIALVSLTPSGSPGSSGSPGPFSSGGSAGVGVAGVGVRVRMSVLGVALAAGAMFGIFLALLAQTHDDAGVWPLAAARFTSIPLGLLLVARRNVTLRMPRPIAGWVVAAGVGDIGANALYLFATREGLLSVVAPISALYPVSTVLLALTLDKERVRLIQIAGLGLAATALVLTAV